MSPVVKAGLYSLECTVNKTVSAGALQWCELFEISRFSSICHNTNRQVFCAFTMKSFTVCLLALSVH